MSAMAETVRRDCGEPHGQRANVRLNEPLSRHTSWRVGGAAERFFWPEDQADLVRFVGSLRRDEPLFWLGLGTNVLVRDGGIRGTVICLANRLKSIELLALGRVRVAAGVPSAHVARFCADHGLTGTEFLAGIPGTFGGALAMNAGAHGGTTWARVVEAELLTVDGEIMVLPAAEFVASYRSVRQPRAGWFLAATLQLLDADADHCRSTIKALLARRNATQPTQIPNGGSVFKNPPGDYAGRLIEAAGLKGCSIGGARVSPKHANFIENTGNATAADIETLMTYIQNTVTDRFGLVLQPEVLIVGDKIYGEVKS